VRSNVRYLNVLVKMNEKITIAICTKNSIELLKNSLPKVLDCNPHEVLLIDGNSSDGTLEFVKTNFNFVKLLSDQGLGLSYARRIAVENSTGDLILFVGPDNLIDNFFVEKMIKFLKESEYCAISAQTRVKQPISNFWDNGLDLRWKYLMGNPGEISVAGTPSLYYLSILKQINFSKNNLGPSDDTELAERLKKAGYKIGLAPILAHDKNNWSRHEIWNKFFWYGTGDYFFYNSKKSNWTMLRKIKSIFHPMRQSMKYSIKSILELNFKGALWFIYTMTARYSGWISKIKNN
jgi:glycosyltransferase involved in cell wall biosynthesis